MSECSYQHTQHNTVHKNNIHVGLEMYLFSVPQNHSSERERQRETETDRLLQQNNNNKTNK